MIKNHEFHNPNKVSILKTYAANILARTNFHKSRIGYFIFTAADIMRFNEYISARHESHQYRRKREMVWNDLLAEANSEITVFEFGVAHGYTTREMLKEKNIKKYYGFDTFTGLPHEWRKLPIGHFSNEGVPPRIQDNRLVWVVGDVFSTEGNELGYDPKEKSLVIFDFDLKEPSVYAYEMCRRIGAMKAGALIYLDEVFDSGEFELLTDYISRDFFWRPISRTWSSIGIELIAERFIK